MSRGRAAYLARLLSQQVKHHAAPVRGRTVLENVNPLPGAERHSAIFDRDRELCQRECGADVRRHIVGTFHGVAVQPVVFRRQAAEKSIQVVDHVRIGVLLDGQRGRRVLDEEGQETLTNGLLFQPSRDLTSEFVEPFAARGDGKPVGELVQMRL
jgi:hypothetical protein